MTFVRVPNKVGGEIQMSMFDMTGFVNAVGKQVSGWGYYPTSLQIWNGYQNITENKYRGIEGDIYMNATFYAKDAATIAPGIRGHMIMLHEIGHILGFKHPFSGSPTIIPPHDNGAYTLMSYNVAHNQVTLGSLDKQAVKLVYGKAGISAKWNAKAQAVEQEGSAAGQWHLGSPLRDIVHAKAGNDTIRTKGGNDRIFDGAGNDSVDAGEGDDFIRAGQGQDVFRGGPGWDMLSYEDNPTRIGINLAKTAATLGAAGDRLHGIEAIKGTDFNDWVKGNWTRNSLFGHAGNDTLLGDGNNDILRGGAGNDQVHGGPGDDTLFGGSGFDRVFGGDGKDRLHGGAGQDQLTGGFGADTFVFDKTSGRDRILDFRNDVDVIDMKGLGLAGVSAVLAKASQVGDNVVFDFGVSLKLTVEDMTIAELRDDILV